MPYRWRGVLLREGVETQEYVHRVIDPGAARWRDLPRDLGCVFEEGAYGHENAVVVGTIDLIERRDSDIYAEGAVLMGNEDADRWVNMNLQGALRGTSVDITGGECIVEIVNAQTGEVVPEEIGVEILFGPEADEYYVRERWTDAEIGSTAVLRVPAFAEATIEVFEVEGATEEPAAGEPADVVAASAGFASIDEVEVGTRVTWIDADGGSHSGQVTAVDPDTEIVTVREDSGDDEDAPMEVTLPVGDVTVEGGDDSESEDEGDDASSTGFPELERRAAAASPRPALASMLARSRGEVVTASALARPGAVLTASVAWDDGPPAEWFEPMNFTEPTPFTITDEGEVFGHIAVWGQCHTGFASGMFARCLVPEPSPSNYALFHANGQVRCADGSRVRVGVLAMDTTHAPAGRPGRRPPPHAVTEHYENTGLQLSWLRANDGPVGPEVHGALRAGVDIDSVRRAMASRPSGDWRNYGDGLDMLGLLLVNVPGYPVLEVDHGETSVLVASLSPPVGLELAAVEEPDEHGHSACACQSGAARSTLATNRRLRLAALSGAFR